MSLNHSVSSTRRQTTLTRELERLIDVLTRAENIGRTAERIASDISGAFPTAGSTAPDDDAADGYLGRLHTLIDGIDAALGRASYAYQRIEESLTDHEVKQAAEGFGLGDGRYENAIKGPF